MKYETYENTVFLTYLLFLLAVLSMTIFSLFVTESGTFIMLVFGIFGFITMPIAIVLGGATAIVVLLSLIRFKKLTTGYRLLTIATLFYIIGCTFVPNLPWGGESFSSVYGPIFTGISIIYACLGIWLMSSTKSQHKT